MKKQSGRYNDASKNFSEKISKGTSNLELAEKNLFQALGAMGCGELPVRLI